MTIQIKKFKPTSHKIKALVYGASWSWKTSFGATAPKVIYASAEAGLLSVWNKDIDYVDIKTVKDFEDLYLFLANQEHWYETVVIDSITEINDIIKSEIEKKKGRPLQLQDWSVVAKKIQWILRQFRWLDMHVLFIAQEKENTDEGKISKIVPTLNGESANKIAYFMDIVGHMEVTPTWEHIINTFPHPKLLTKDRTSLIWNSTEANFQSWIDKLEQIEIGKEEIVSEYWGEEQIKEEKFEEIFEKINGAKDMNDLQNIYKNFLKELKVKPLMITSDHKKKISKLKDDKKASFE